jgi:hypothetical protein
MKRCAIIRRTPLKRVGLKRKQFVLPSIRGISTIRKDVAAKFCAENPFASAIVKPAAQRTRIRARSPKKRADDAKYARAKEAHFAEFPRCQHPDGCTRSLLRGDPMDLHHRAGRNGPLLYCKRYFATACRHHHDLAKTQISASRANGWIVDVSSEEVRRLRTEEILSS